MKTIVICNEKGGTGKTATAFSLCCGLSSKGYKVLAVDLDGQTNFSSACGIDTRNEKKDIIRLLEREKKDAIINTELGFDIIAGTEDSKSFVFDKESHVDLKNILKPLKYDYCIIDTARAISILTEQALKACSSVILPLESDKFSLQGLQQFKETLDTMAKGVKIEGILLTRYDKRATFNKQLKEALEIIAHNMNTRVFNATIRQSVTIRKCMFYAENLFTAYPKENITADYNDLIEEIIKGDK